MTRESAPMELVSPELVLVAPPDLARRARERLPFPWEVLPQAIAAVPERPPRRLAVAAFALVCAANGVAPVALVIAARALA
jgi:hypothetical protein